VLNWIWLGLILVSIAYAAPIPGRMEIVSSAILDGASKAVTLVIGLVGAMVFFLGLTRVAFDGGLRDWFARTLTPITQRLFPEVPPDHPAMGAMVMNMASNMMGLGNAATPFGLKAMGELARLNPLPGTASNAMVLFLAINTSAITLFPPFGTIAVRAAADSSDAWAIWGPTLIATTCSTISAMLGYWLLGKLPIFSARASLDAAPLPSTETAAPDAATAGEIDPATGLSAGEVGSAERQPLGWIGKLFVWGFVGVVAYGLVTQIATLLPSVGGVETIKVIVRNWIFPLMVGGMLLIGVTGGVRVYDSMIEGAKEGLQVALRIVPFLVAILTAVAMFRASGALDVVIAFLNPYTSAIGVPAEVLPMAFLRPLSGSGAFGVMSEIITTYGPDSFIGYLTCTLMGSTETTFYVLALYFGAAGIVDGRHALAACLIGDLGGFVGAVAACHWFFG
jgi:spore maturation protein SpmA